MLQPGTGWCTDSRRGRCAGLAVSGQRGPANPQGMLYVVPSALWATVLKAGTETLRGPPAFLICRRKYRITKSSRMIHELKYVGRVHFHFILVKGRVWGNFRGTEGTRLELRLPPGWQDLPRQSLFPPRLGTQWFILGTHQPCQ